MTTTGRRYGTAQFGSFFYGDMAVWYGPWFMPPPNAVVSLSNPWEGTVCANALLSHFKPIDRSPNLWRLALGVYTTIDPDYGEPYEILYLGAHITPITEAEAIDLTAAGYGAGIIR